jgi:hypothetical protein
MPVPSKKVFPYGSIAQQRVGFVGIPDIELVEVQSAGTGLR